MKTSERKTLRVWIMILAAIALVAGTAYHKVADAGAEPTAKVSHVEGTATYQLGRKGVAKALTTSVELTRKHYVKTEADGKVELTFGDGSVLRIAPKSRVRMKSLLAQTGSEKRDVGIKVQAGKIWANVSKAVGSDTKFEIETDNAVAGVRGTIFRVDMADDDATVVKVYSGAVAVSNAPIYQRAGATKANRKQVPGPRQVSKKQWEELIAKAMQEIRVSSSGQMGKPTAFNAEQDRDDWVKWNEERDKKLASR